MKLVGKRKRARPKRIWIDCVKENMEMAGVKEEDAKKRSTWRTAICTGDPLRVRIKPGGERERVLIIRPFDKSDQSQSNKDYCKAEILL